MSKRLTFEEKKEKAFIDLINQMFIIAGHDAAYDDIKDRKDDWYQQWTITNEESEEFLEWGKRYLMKHLQSTAKLAEKEMAWFFLAYGLKQSD